MIRTRQLGFVAGDSDKRILSGIDVDIAPGTRLALVGPSGSGKTTLGFHFCGVHRQALLGRSSGSLQLNGRECINADYPGFAGVVLQNPATQLFCRTAREEVALGPESLGRPAAEVRSTCSRLLDDWQLTDVADRPLDQLSHGMKQRVSIAAMLAIRPQVLLLDEPTNFLDPDAADRLFELLAEVSQQGTTLLLIDHDRERLDPWASEVLRLANGRRQTGDEPPQTLPALPVTTPGPALLTAAELSFSFAEQVILDAAGFTLHAGEIVALTGPNGAGKTTLLRLLKDLLKPTAGSIRLAGGGRRLDRVGLVLQDPDQQLFAPTVRAECGFILKNQAVAGAERDRRIAAALQAVGLEDAAERLPMSLSYGEKRRLALASILVGRPPVLCLDEPTVGLDYDNLGRLQQQLRKHADDGATILLATHDLAFARATAARRLHLEQGRLTERGYDD